MAGETEEEIYQALGLPWIPPELRENTGRNRSRRAGPPARTGGTRRRSAATCTCTPPRPTAAPRSKRWPKRRARTGYEYIAITDHSKALAMANGLDEKRVVAFARSVREINRNGLGIRVFSGIECDILKDGAMDLANDALAELDLVIGSVHSHMNLEAAEMTDRLLRALECPHLRILGHPTGRMLLHRDPYPFDFERVVAEAVRRGVWLEINASPERLDLQRRADPQRQSQGREVHHLHRRAPSQAPGQHALRRGDGAARLARPKRYPEYAARGRVRRGASEPNHENHIFQAKSTIAACFG